MKLRWTIGLSLIVHALIYFSLNQSVLDLAKLPTQSRPIEVDYVESVIAPKAKTLRHKSKQKAQSSPLFKSAPSVSIKKLLQTGTSWKNLVQGTKNKTASKNDILPALDPVFNQMNSLGIEELSPLLPFFERIWRKIDAHLDYPNDFVQQRISGKVRIDFYLLGDGIFSGKVIKLSSKSPLLENYVLATIMLALKNPLPKTRQIKSQKIAIGIIVDFETESYHLAEEEEGHHSKNYFYFKRRRYVDPKLNQAINRVLTKYVPPIIPIPGGVYIDFYRLYKMIKSYDEPDEDNLRRRRIENTFIQLKDYIKKEND